MRLPIPYVLSATLAGFSVAIGAYIIWSSYTAHRIVLSHFPEFAPKEERSLASVSDDYYAYGHSDEVPPVIYSLGEMLVNVGANAGKNHFVRLHLEFELFDESGRTLVEQGQAGVKHTVIEALRGQSYDRLKTLDGKLYFKEDLASRINAFLNHPAVRQVHFSSFYLQ